MLLDKKKVRTVTKVIAVFIALTFILMYIPTILNITDEGANTPAAQDQSQADMVAKTAALEKAVQANPKDLGNLILLGNAYHGQQIHDKAIDTYTRVLELDPKNVDVRIDRATNYFYSGQVDTATAEGIKGVELDPKHANARFNLGIFYSAQGKNKEAIESFKAYLKLEPKGEGADRAKAQIAVLEKAVK
ncbi:MAG: tetratricopeptide repeat protein [Candidatus Aquicultor sp.]|nr:tetratricopeptide repeat protein [Candidatus Aquicultor sp.]